MRTTLFATTALLITACGAPTQESSSTLDTSPVTIPPVAESVLSDGAQLAAMQAAYGPDWYVDFGWSGEYPPGFTVLEEGVELMARAMPDKSAPRSISCPIPKNANVHQWNMERVDADDMLFIEANPIVVMAVTKDATLLVENPDSEMYAEMEVPVTEGETIKELRYYGEGFGAIEYKGTEYVAELGHIMDFSIGPEDDGRVFDEWVRLNCHDDTRTVGWLLLSDTVDVPGIGVEFIEGFGESRDLPDPPPEWFMQDR